MKNEQMWAYETLLREYNECVDVWEADFECETEKGYAAHEYVMGVQRTMVALGYQFIYNDDFEAIGVKEGLEGAMWA